MNALKGNLGILKNFGYLSGLQILNLIIPLLLYPFLIRVLKAEFFGLIVYAQAFIGFFVVVINFGFNITATKEVSLNRGSIKELSRIFSSVLLLKSFLFLICFLIVLVLSYLIPEIGENRVLFYLTMWLCLFEVIFPVWYFQGIEQFKFVTIFNVVGKIVLLTLIFLFVKEQSDYLLVPIFNIISTIIVGAFCFYVVLFRHGLSISLQPFDGLLIYVKNSYVMALAYFANVFKSNIGILLIKNLFSYSEVAYFDLAFKIMNLGNSLLDMISQSVFPKMSKSFDLKLFKYILLISIVGASIGVVFMYVFGEYVVILLGGPDMLKSVPLTKILVLSWPFYIISALFGRNALFIFGKESSLLTSMFFSVLVFAILVFVFSSESNYLIVVCFSFLFSVVFEAFYRYKSCVKFKIVNVYN